MTHCDLQTVMQICCAFRYFYYYKSVFIPNPKIPKLIGLICLTLYLLVLSRPLLPYLEFAINQDFIASVLCINREKPEVECGGKCHLTKQLQKAGKEETEQQKPATVRIETEPLPLAITRTKYSGLVHLPDRFASLQQLQTIFKDYIETPPSPPPRHLHS